MIYLITGLPGSGKSFYSVSKIIDLASAGETVYSNIADLSVPSVQPIPDDLDWQNLPDGSHVFYDEAQKNNIFKAKGRETISNNPILSGLETHRHRGFNIYFITQDAKFLHKHILSLAGSHTNISRPLGVRFPAVYQWGHYQPNPDSNTSKKQADSNTNFSLKKSVFQYYKSTTIDNHKTQWSKLAKLFFMPALAIIALSYVFLGDNYFFSTKSKSSTQPTDTQSTVTSESRQKMGTLDTTQQTSNPVNDSITHELTRPAQIIASSAGDCYAKNSYGELLDISPEKCRMYSEHPNLLSGSRVQQQYNDQNSGAISTSADGLTAARDYSKI